MCTSDVYRMKRREFLAQACRVSAAIAIATNSRWVEAEISSAGPGTLVYAGAKRKAEMMGLDQVELKTGPFQDAMARNSLYLLSLDPDRFLHYFRTTAGLPARAEPYGGWESKVGRMLGHYLSACSMYVKATGSPDFTQRQSYVVSELAACQKANGDGYVGGVSDARRVFREIAAGNIYIDKVGLNGVHAPWYMLHKMCAGLRDAYFYGQNQEALVVLTGFSNWAYGLTDTLSVEQMQKMLGDEHGGMNDVFADLYAFTHEDKYLTLSRRFNHHSVLDPLTKGIDDLDGLHANTQLPTVIGLYRQYEVSGDEAARRGGVFFWDTVTERRSYANGGDSDKERFYPVGQMGTHLSPATAETCNSYNMVKLTDRLFASAPDEKTAAYSERVLWNHILASQDKTTPGMTYYMSLAPGHFKTFSTPYDSFWCCVGTGMENHAKYGESIYFSSADELWINQFIASSVFWKEKKMHILQETRFPYEQQSKWTISCEHPTQAALQIRHPVWAGEEYAIKINGKLAAVSRPGTYARLERKWRNGDVITVALPMRLTIEKMQDDPTKSALFYGPIVLAGLLGRAGMPESAPYAGNDQLQFRSVPDPVVPSLKKPPQAIGPWAKQVAPLEFEAASSIGDEKIRFIPLYEVTHDRYSIYWNMV